MKIVFSWWMLALFILWVLIIFALEIRFGPRLGEALHTVTAVFGFAFSIVPKERKE